MVKSKPIVLLMFALLLLAAPPAATRADELSAPAAKETLSKEPAKEREKEKQLTDIEANTAIWVLIIFVVLAIILYKTAWKNVLVGLKAREQRIRSDIAAAEATRAKAEATLREYSAQLATAEGKVRELLNEATVQTQRIAEQGRVRAQADAEQIRERALKDIDEASKQAVNEIYQQAAGLATSVAEKILRRNLNVEDQRDLVTRSVDQIGKITSN